MKKQACTSNCSNNSIFLLHSYRHNANFYWTLVGYLLITIFEFNKVGKLQYYTKKYSNMLHKTKRVHTTTDLLLLATCDSEIVILPQSEVQGKIALGHRDHTKRIFQWLQFSVNALILTMQ